MSPRTMCAEEVKKKIMLAGKIKAAIGFGLLLYPYQNTLSGSSIVDVVTSVCIASSTASYAPIISCCPCRTIKADNLVDPI